MGNKSLDTIPWVNEGNRRRTSGMPVPGSLKRVPIDEREIALLLERQFSLPFLETRAYLKLLETPVMTLEEIAGSMSISREDAYSLTARMVSEGLIIEAVGNPKRYSPLHPRMTLTNLFKTYEKDVVEALRERRRTVDRVVNLLTPIYEERVTKASD